MQQVKNLVGAPLLTPYPYFSPISLLDGALYMGTATLDETEIAVSSTYGAKVVFGGDFIVSGDDVTGGTMTSFEVFIGATRVLKAKGFSTDAADLYDAIEAYSTDTEAFDDLIPGASTRFVGSDYADFLIDQEFGGGGGFDDVILGRKGDDILFAFEGKDTLKGGKGNDWLYDAVGVNKFYGGAGRDTFAFQIFSSQDDVPIGKIKDFVRGEDIINLTTDIPDFQIGWLSKQFFHKGTSAEGPDDYIIYDRATGRIFIDYDGGDPGAQIHFATVTRGMKLQAEDFIVGLGPV